MHQVEELLRQLRLDPENEQLKQQIRDFIRENPDDALVNRLLKSHWKQQNMAVLAQAGQRLEMLLEQIHQQAGIKKQPENPFIPKPKQQRFWQVAAAVILPLLLFAGLQFFNFNWGKAEMLVLESGTQTRHLLLPDSTEVWLNSASKITYSARLNREKKRLITLSGQAYFKVKHDAAHPFVVQTTQMDIRVLGTQFDVSAYPNDAQITSTLKEGSIALLDKSGRQVDQLVPGEQAVLKLSNLKIYKTKVEAADFTSWISGKLIFRDAAIGDVARKLERRYGCTISISPGLQAENPTYSFSLNQESLDEICRLIELSTNAKATINGTHIQLDKN